MLREWGGGEEVGEGTRAGLRRCVSVEAVRGRGGSRGRCEATGASLRRTVLRHDCVGMGCAGGCRVMLLVQERKGTMVKGSFSERGRTGCICCWPVAGGTRGREEGPGKAWDGGGLTRVCTGQSWARASFVPTPPMRTPRLRGQADFLRPRKRRGKGVCLKVGSPAPNLVLFPLPGARGFPSGHRRSPAR